MRGSAIAAFAATANREATALAKALDALRKISLAHPCDNHGLIARGAVQDVEAILKGA